MEIVELKTTTLKLDYCHSMPHESNFPAHFFSMLIMSKKYLMAVKHDTFGERQKIPHSTFSLWTLILRESEVLKVPNKLGIQPCFAFLLFCMKLFCIRLRVWNTSNFPVEPPLPKFAFFVADFQPEF